MRRKKVMCCVIVDYYSIHRNYRMEQTGDTSIHPAQNRRLAKLEVPVCGVVENRRVVVRV